MQKVRFCCTILRCERLVFHLGRCSVSGLAALGDGHSVAFYLFPPPALLQFTICRWKNVDVELPNAWTRAQERARRAKKRLGYFFGCNFSRSGYTVSCTSVRPSLRIGGKGTTGLSSLPRPTSKCHLITPWSDFFLTRGCQICLFCQL